MRVRVWIRGVEGPAHDFELVEAPRIGERITISLAGHSEEGIVRNVTWQLQGIERAQDDLAIEAEPVGSVTIVHVLCAPHPGEATPNEAAAEAELTS
jgi:hypothetical protein